jgi:ABC-type glutathione transport system ATPase component
MTALDRSTRSGSKSASCTPAHRVQRAGRAPVHSNSSSWCIQAHGRLDAYPHELSGGLRQRAMIAMALSCNPRLLLADEPTTALDATVQVQVLILLRRLQRELGIGMIFVTHDLGVAAEIADTVAVMYAGRIVESGPVVRVLKTPAHPYTAGFARLDRARSAARTRHRHDSWQPPRPASPPAAMQLRAALPPTDRRLPPSSTRASPYRARPDGSMFRRGGGAELAATSDPEGPSRGNSSSLETGGPREIPLPSALS